jgi:hypothetical protein
LRYLQRETARAMIHKELYLALAPGR